MPLPHTPRVLGHMAASVPCFAIFSSDIHLTSYRTYDTFQHTHPNATAMYQRASTFPCPLGIVHTASANWKRCSDRKFFGHSYTAPTPVEYTLQQLGLGVVKALSIHHSHALGKFGTKPPPKPRRTAVATPSPPRFLHPLDLFNPVTEV